MAKKRRDPLYWAKGRLVAIRPDGARKNFDPEAIWAIRTQGERDRAAEVLEQLYERVKDRDGKPEWYHNGAANGSNGFKKPPEAEPDQDDTYEDKSLLPRTLEQ